MSFSFDQWVQAIIAHRKANPRFNLATDVGTVETELEVFTAAMVSRMPGTENLFAKGAQAELPKAQDPPSPLEKDAVTAAGVVGKVVVGARIILDWLGSGGRPAPAPLALTRAVTCFDCALNLKADWTTWASGLVAKSIREQLEAKHSMQLRTQLDAELKTCSACTCWIPLKIWCPIAHIAAYSTPAITAALDPGCWVIREMDATPKSL